ncbi:MAG: DUF3578 domain-containing protein [Alphaproteobacteria bacterium]|jgi:MoxR-like ATPase|nr:DUF3578 domain-containing protein [Alphaproteobacteria bacterium]
MAKTLGVPDHTFVALAKIRQTGLVEFGSLFSPGRQLWDLVNLKQFHKLFVEGFDEGEGSFLGKFRKQLQGARDDTLQLAAELLYVQQFFTAVTKPDKKIENVRTVLGWCVQPPPIPEWAVVGLERGLSADISFNQHRPFHLAWLSEYLIHWHEQTEPRRQQLLSNPTAFALDARSIEPTRGAYQPMLEAWLFMIFPDYFENISSRKHKKQIRDAFLDLLGSAQSNNVDEDLFTIRRELTKTHGEGFSYYRPPVVQRWQTSVLTTYDVEQIRLSRSLERYADFSNDQRTAHKRVHEVLSGLGKVVVQELGGDQSYSLKLTSGFHPNSGIRGGKPKDLWFGVYLKENEKELLGNPQLFMIVSGHGVEYGFSPLTHPDDFSNQALRHRTREIARQLLGMLPTAGSPDARQLKSQLEQSGNWHFRRKQRLAPNQSDFASLDDWLSFEKSEQGAANAGGGITRYVAIEDIDGTDFEQLVRQLTQIFRSLMKRMRAEPNQFMESAFVSASPSTASALPSVPADAASYEFRHVVRLFRDELAKARSGPFQKSDMLWNAMEDVRSRLEKFPTVRERADLLVNVSVGQGNWASVPWIALLNTKITRSTQEGIYVVFLFSADLSRVFLTLNQGTANLVRDFGQREAQKRLLDVAANARTLIAGQAAVPLVLDNNIHLGADGLLARNYKIGTIAHIDFKTDELPSDENVDGMLRVLLEAYDQCNDALQLAQAAAESALAPAPPPPEHYGFDLALSELLLDESSVRRLLTMWDIKKNLILQGAPGVGKSFVARRLAYLLLGEKDPQRIESVQFHQSYSYEDFVQGYRPDGKGGFALRDGIFHRFCERASLSPDEKYVFVIDEINRGNLSKIFGELMLLIESDKRGSEWATRLTYSQTGEAPFFIPKNLYVIGMMNTADRSLSIVDYALRRRFAFASLEPMFSSQQFPMLLMQRGIPEEVTSKIVKLMTALNTAIGEDRANLGLGYRIGHSFFVPPEDFKYEPNWYRQVVEMEICPLLEEYWFDDPEKADEWRLRLLEDDDG